MIFFLLMGLLDFGICKWLEQNHERIQKFTETECVIIWSGTDSYETSSSGSNSSCTMYTPAVRYKYSVNGREFEGDRIQPGSSSSSDQTWAIKQSKLYPVGKSISCYYNSENPSEVFLDKKPVLGLGIFWALGFLFIGLSVAMIIIETKIQQSNRSNS